MEPIIIIISTLIAITLFIFIFNKKKVKLDTNQNALFILGGIFLIVGIANDISGMWMVGIIFFIAGASQNANRQNNP